MAATKAVDYICLSTSEYWVCTSASHLLSSCSSVFQ